MSGPAYWRQPPAFCEACGTAPPQYRIGISVLGRGADKLPPSLRGAVVWSCDATECDRSLRARARAACATHGLRAPVLLTIGPRLSGGMPDLPD